MAGNLTADFLDSKVRLTFRRDSSQEWHREGNLSMITHTRSKTRVRLGMVDFGLSPTEIVEVEFV